MVAVNYGLNQSRVFIGVLAGPRKPRNLRNDIISCLGLQNCEGWLCFDMQLCIVLDCSPPWSPFPCSVFMCRVCGTSAWEPGSAHSGKQKVLPGGSSHTSAWFRPTLAVPRLWERLSASAPGGGMAASGLQVLPGPHRSHS